MKYLLYKLVIADDPGANVFETFSQDLLSIREIDESYEGPEHYWSFFQLGDFDYLDVTIVKWELWSCWHLKGEKREVNKGAFIGTNALLGFYHSEEENSFQNIQKMVSLFVEKRKSRQSPIIVYDLDRNKIDNIPKEQLIFFKENNVNLFFVKEKVLKKKNNVILNKLFGSFVKTFNPRKARDLEITKNWWNIDMEELRRILKADRGGIKLEPRHKKEEKVVEEEKVEKEEEVFKKKEGFTQRKLSLEDLSDEDLKHVAIGPDGEIIPREELEEKDEEEILELVKEGYQLPDWVVIPRHCPKCFNQNQRSIREVDNKDVILMERPRIYAKKYICGKCGNEWS